MVRKKKDAKLPAAPIMLPLTPKYREDRHGIYFSAIESALTGTQQASIRNIALTGSYGVGKSSILQKVADEHKRTSVSISLSSLGFADEEKPANGVAAIASSKTNRIQKEIVKQLLYGEDPVKMPGSRYRRITRFRFWRELGLGLLVAIPIVLVFFLSGWSRDLATLFRIPTGFEDLINIGIWLVSAFFLVGIRKVLHNRIHIDKISAGDATIALSAESPTFFDEYLDEIVYFFEMTKTDIVIFEDIDRFDDAHIFETLRSLNTLLNGAKQLGDRNIRFIYAIKDSIFDELGARAAAAEKSESEKKKPKNEKTDAAEAEIARANRTKFFDLVVPVVPFVTHRSARDLLKSVLSDIDHKVSDDLIDLAASYVADMRLLTNIRNEFAIFRQRIIVEGSLDLDDDKLLAMVLYKSTHMTDFELIKTGQSNLDDLYADNRLLVNASINALSASVHAARQERGAVHGAALRSQRLGDSLSEYVQRIVHYLMPDNDNPDLSVDGAEITQETLRSADFWEKIATGSSVLTITLSIRVPSYGSRPHQIVLDKQAIELALGEPIVPKDWAASRRAVLDKQIADAAADQEFLQHADMSDLAVQPKFKYDGRSFDDMIEARLGSELARQLLRAGYIDRNYTLYTSTFYANRVSASATNFILKNVDPNQMDVRFELAAEDVRAILRERGRAFLEQKAAYNVSVLEYLLGNDQAGAKALVGHLAAGGEDERAVLAAYFDAGKKQKRLVRALMSLWPKAIEYLILDAPLEDGRRLELVDVALSSISGEVSYGASEGVGTFLEEHLAALSTLVSDDTTDQAASALAELLVNAGVTVSDLGLLGEKVRASVVDMGAFSVSRSNLLLALGDAKADLALDAVAEANQVIYERLLEDLPAYLGCLEDDEATVSRPTRLVGVITDVVAADLSQVGKVIEKAVADASTPDLASVPSTAWEYLAEGYRFPATFANVRRYLDDIGMEWRLGRLLAKALRIMGVDSVEHQSKLALALEILGAQKEIGLGSARSSLIESLGLDEYIEPESVPIEEGELVGDLIGNYIVEDTRETFTRLQPNDWPGREHAIRYSKAFATFATASELPPADLGHFFSSVAIPDAVKVAILERIGEFTARASGQALAQVADFALSSGQGLGLETIAGISRSIGEGRTLRLLERHLPGATLTELTPVLSALGGEFRKLIGSTGKHPKFVDPSSSLKALIERVNQLGYVSTIEDHGASIRVNMKRG